MHIGFYPRYNRLGASSRTRFFLYFDRWREMEPKPKSCGGSCSGCVAPCGEVLSIHPGLSDGYLRALYAGKCGAVRKFWEWCRLGLRLLALEDALVIEYELLPEASYRTEAWFLRHRRYVLNFDDNVWEKYRDRPRLRGKYDALIANAAGVIVANRFLYEKVRPLNANLCLIPTVVDLDAYRRDEPKYETFTVVWIGTPVTYDYLERMLPALQAMSEAVEFELLVVARRELARRPLAGVKVRWVDWSAETEAEYLCRSHVGIMPLVDDAFSVGKSAFKLIQYQAAGLPSLASPVGENCRVVTTGKNGFLPETPGEWAEALRWLHDGAELYCNCAAAARANAYEYSLQKYFPIYREFVTGVLTRP